MGFSVKRRLEDRGEMETTEQELEKRIEESPYGPRTRELLRKWMEVESTGEPGFAAFRCPPIMTSGSGASIWDVDGKEYIDCLAGYSVNNIGISNVEVIEAIGEQLKKLIQYYDFPSVPRIKLSQTLINITPGDFSKKVIYSVTGSEGVETAVQLARWYTGKPFILVPYGDYHGRTPGTMSMTGEAGMWAYYNPVPPWGTAISYFPYPYCYRCPYDKSCPSCKFFCIKALESLFNNTKTPFMNVQKGISNVAAIIIEPMQASAGYIIPPTGYLAKLQEVCRKYGILLIADEVQSGMGRTGKMWACEHSGVTPDMIIFGKAIAGGLPISGVVGRKEIMDSWGPGGHLGTFAGTVLACAAANKVLEIMERDDIPQKTKEMGDYFIEGLEGLAKKHSIVGDVKGKGLFIGIEFVRDRKTKEPATKESSFMEQQCLEKGLICSHSGYFGNRFCLIPPLVISKDQIDRAMKIFDNVFTEAERKFNLL